MSPTSAILSSRAAALLPAFIEGFQSPREYFLARLGSLGPAAAAVNAQFDALGAASLGGVPCLLVGGTADELALSASEVPRLQALLAQLLAPPRSTPSPQSHWQLNMSPAQRHESPP